MLVVRFFVLVAVLVVTLTSFDVAHAAGSDPAAAEALFRAGREAMKRGDPQTACARFGESHRLDPAPGTLLNLAECDEILAKLATAWAHLREAIDGMQPNDDRIPDAKRKVLELEPRLPRVVIRLASGAPPSSKVTRDGVDVGPGSFGVPLPVDPGRHTVLVTAPGFADRRYDIVTAERTETELVVDVGATMKPVSSPTSSPRETTAGGRTPGWILLGASLVAVGVGTATGVLAIDRNQSMSDHCDATRVCDGIGVAAASEGRTFDVASTVSFVAAGVLAGSGLYWLFTHPASARR